MASKRHRLLKIPGGWTASELSVNYKPGIKYERPIINSIDAFAFIRSVWDNERIAHQEQYMAAFINGKCKTIGYRLICTGGMYSVPIDMRLIVSLALHTLATNVIVAHNHPSGDLTPSNADLTTTKRLQKALKLIDVTLWDHLIISDRDYLSMSDEKLI